MNHTELLNDVVELFSTGLENKTHPGILVALTLEILFVPVLCLLTIFSLLGKIKVPCIRRLYHSILTYLLVAGSLWILFNSPENVWEQTDGKIPENMTGVVIDYSLQVKFKNDLNIPRPVPLNKMIGWDTALLRVKASGINPRDYKVHPQYFPMIRWLFPSQVGHDVAGTVVARTSGCRLHLDQDVFGSAITGSAAQYALVWCDDTVVAKPRGLSFEDAAALPTPGRSAVQGMTLASGIETPTVLVVGASGGCGSVGVRYAKHLGATVIGICSTKSMEYVKQLGADTVIDYTTSDFSKELSKLNGTIDIIYDTVTSFEGPDFNYEPILRGLLKPHGMYVSLNGHLSDWTRAIISYAVGVNVQRDSFDIPLPPSNLTPFYEEIGKAMTTTSLSINTTTKDLTSGPQVYKELKSRRVKGKIILIP